MSTPHQPKTVGAEAIERAATQIQSGGTTVTIRSGTIAPVGFTERYSPERMLGEGGMGTVALCHDRQIGRRVALKALRPEALSNATMRERFVREAQVQGQLEHPAIVPVYDLGADPDGTPFFTMKRVRGATLADVLDRVNAGDPEALEKYPRRRLLGVFASVCLAVHFAHEMGVLHRDLKPANIMLGDFGEVYVLDWGVAKVVASPDPPLSQARGVHPTGALETRAGSVLGTPGYMAPEQLRGEHESLGPAADVYALGAILFELLAGEPLHDTSTADAAVLSTMQGVDASPSKRATARVIAPELDVLCRRATAKNVVDRYVSARELHDALESWLDGERDVEMRRQLAKEHGQAAAKAVSRALRGSPADVELRREAMREVGKALALDPTNVEATRAMMLMLQRPPRQLPPEVGEALEDAERRKTRKVGRFGVIAYGSLFAYLPIFFWAGVRWPLVLAASFVFIGGAAVASGVAAVSRRPSPYVVLAAMLSSSIGCAITAAFFGPLFFMPGVVAINSTAYVAHSPREHRWFIVGIALLSVVAPFVLQLTGIAPPSYAFGPQGMTILPGAVAFTPVGTTAFLAISGVAMVLLSTLSVRQIRDALGDAERRLMVHTWHLGSLVENTDVQSVQGTVDSAAE